VLLHVLVGEPDPPSVKPEGMLRRDMRQAFAGCGLPLTVGSGMIAATTNAA
jgi:hypothetical protein